MRTAAVLLAAFMLSVGTWSVSRAQSQIYIPTAIKGHIVGTHCLPAGASCLAKSIKPGDHRTETKVWPKVVSAHIVLDSVQAKTPGNEHVKQCGQTKPGETCWDPALRHIVNHLYGTNKERCERDEGVPCEELQPCVVQAESTHSYADYERCRQWVPIGKPVFEDKTPEPEAKPFAIARNEWSTIEPLIVKDHHGCVYSFTWDEDKQACSITVSFSGVGIVTCSPITNDPGVNAQTMVCWYKPEATKSNK